MTHAGERLGASVPIAVLDSITKLDASHRGAVVVAGSHGGRYCGWLASQGGVRALALNDAGVGLDSAGISCLAPLDAIGLAALTVDYRSARIGDGQDMLQRGRVSHVNAAAAVLGCKAGMTLQLCVPLLQTATTPTAVLPLLTESRSVLANIKGVTVLGLDSVSLIDAQDRHCIAVTGSHGGLLGGQPQSAVRQRVLAAAFNDAGGGADGAGYSRLPALDTMGIAGLTVAHGSARIGDARSAWATGVVSAVNRHAQQAGAEVEMQLSSAVEAMVFGAA